jgi:iron(II)-dependent oxidoreductase
MVTELLQNSISELADALREARERTLELIEDLSDEQMIGPRLEIVNPLRWELGHVAWFQEYWILRCFRGQEPTRENGDQLYDSARISHDTRWDLPLPSKAETIAYMQRILERVSKPLLGDRMDPKQKVDGYDQAYYMRLALFHECMHAEAITYTRQTLSYPAPRIGIAENSHSRRHLAEDLSGDGSGHLVEPSKALGDAEIAGGEFLLGSTADLEFVFDNEQWAHPVTFKPFRMARAAVTNGELAAFVEDGGYTKRRLWSEEGWRWREAAAANHPVYWQKDASGGWLRRNFDQWLPLEQRKPVLHVNWYEAEAYCRWAGRRLPTETEWEMASSATLGPGASSTTSAKSRFPWGETAPTPERANLNWRRMGCVNVDELPHGDSAFGCRQMIGNVWEWTASDFGPYPGFSPGPYKEYSAPWFGDHKVLRGGCWATRSSLISNTYRNFYRPYRRDVWAGLRTCAL